jgi:DNA polymerase III epsilon subunit-like protein
VPLSDFLRRLAPRRRPARQVWAANTPLASVRFVAIDVETTGLDPKRDRVVLFAAVAVENLTVGAALAATVVNPEVPIPERATRIHGFDAAAVAGAPTFATAYPAMTRTFADAVVVGHNVAFDLAVLRAEAARRKLSWRQPESVCTAAMVRHLAPHLSELDIVEQARELGAESAGVRHTALGDAQIAGALFVQLAGRLAAAQRGTLGDALALS